MGKVRDLSRILPRLSHRSKEGCCPSQDICKGSWEAPTLTEGMYVWNYVCRYLNVCIYECRHESLYIFLCMHACMYVCVCMYKCMHVCSIHVYIYVCMNVCICIYCNIICLSENNTIDSFGCFFIVCFHDTEIYMKACYLWEVCLFL